MLLANGAQSERSAAALRATGRSALATEGHTFALTLGSGAPERLATLRKQLERGMAGGEKARAARSAGGRGVDRRPLWRKKSPMVVKGFEPLPRCLEARLKRPQATVEEEKPNGC